MIDSSVTLNYSAFLSSRWRELVFWCLLSPRIIISSAKHDRRQTVGSGRAVTPFSVWTKCRRRNTTDRRRRHGNTGGGDQVQLPSVSFGLKMNHLKSFCCKFSVFPPNIWRHFRSEIQSSIEDVVMFDVGWRNYSKKQTGKKRWWQIHRKWDLRRRKFKSVLDLASKFLTSPERSIRFTAALSVLLLRQNSTSKP